MKAISVQQQPRMSSSSSSPSQPDGHDHKAKVCVLDASTYLGFWILKCLLLRGYTVHAAVQYSGDGEMVKKIRELEKTAEKRLVVFAVDCLDYHSILEALNGCSALFCCLDSSDGYHGEGAVETEVRGTINVVEACGRTESVEKMVFSSSLLAAIWRDNILSQNDVDERSWTDPDFCLRKKLWYALAKTESEKAAWALAMDRTIRMVSINGGLVLGHGVAQLNPNLTLSYLQGAAQMYENGVLAFVDVEFLAAVHIRAFEDKSTCGRYFCFNQIVNTKEEALKVAHSLTPLIPLPISYECQQGGEVYAERLRNKKQQNLVEGTAY